MTQPRHPNLQRLATQLGHATPAHALADLCERGRTMRGIAREFEVPFAAVRWCADRHDIKFPRRGSTPLPVDRMQVEATKGMTAKRAAAELGVSVSTIEKWRRQV